MEWQYAFWIAMYVWLGVALTEDAESPMARFWLILIWPVGVAAATYDAIRNNDQ